MASEYRHIGIMGAGAVGSLIGGLLARAGCETILIGRDPHMQAIRRNGLVLRGIPEADGPLIVHPTTTTDVSALSSVDLVVVTVKSQDTEAATRAIKPHLGDSTLVLSLQNGVQNPHVIANELGNERVLAGVVLMGMEFLEPGVVNYSLPGYLLIGEIDGLMTGRLKPVQETLGKAVTTESTGEIEGALWAKLLINLDLPIYALTGQGYPQGLLQPSIHRLSRAVMEEGLETISAADIDLGNSPVVDAMRDKLKMLQLTSQDLEAKLGAQEDGDGFKSSALQSVLRGSSSEVDFINGEIVRLAEAHDLEAPLNRQLVKLSEEQTLLPEPSFMSPDELRQRVSVN